MQPDETDEAPEKRLTLGRRVGLVERDTRAHARSITEIIKEIAVVKNDLNALDEWRMNRLIAEAREDERDRSLSDRLGRIEMSISVGLEAVKLDIKNMRGVWTRIMWIAAGVIVPAAIIAVALTLVKGIAP